MALSLITPDSLNLAQDYAGMGFGGTGSANQLDDVETGDWTPVVIGVTTTGTGVYTSQRGTYVRVGDLVYATFTYSLSSHTGAGFFRINGLPFTSSSANSQESVGSVMVNNFNTGASLGTLNIYVGSNTTQLRLYLSNDNTTWAAQNIDTAHNMIGTITYRAS